MHVMTPLPLGSGHCKIPSAPGIVGGFPKEVLALELQVCSEVERVIPLIIAWLSRWGSASEEEDESTGILHTVWLHQWRSLPRSPGSCEGQEESTCPAQDLDTLASTRSRHGWGNMMYHYWSCSPASEAPYHCWNLRSRGIPPSSQEFPT